MDDEEARENMKQINVNKKQRYQVNCLISSKTFLEEFVLQWDIELNLNTSFAKPKWNSKHNKHSSLNSCAQTKRHFHQRIFC